MNFRLKNQSILVTGAGGFIGSHLTEALLKEGAKVRALVRYNSRNSWGHLEHFSAKTPSNLEVLGGDIRDPHFVDALVQGQTIVFHLAALIAIPYSYLAPQSFVDTNVTGTLNVLEACRKHKVSRMIHTSTSEVYGTAQYVPIDETHPLQGQSPYSASKIAADKLAESYYRSFGTPVVTVRPFNTYGPRQSARAIIPTLITSLLANKKEVQLGDLRPVRDFTYVEDTVQGFIAAALHAKAGDVVNIGSGKGRTIQDVLEDCARVLNVPVPRIKTDSRRIRPGKSEVWKLVCNNSHAKKTLRWKTTVDFQTGLRQTTHYIRTAASSYKTHLYNI